MLKIVISLLESIKSPAEAFLGLFALYKITKTILRKRQQRRDDPLTGHYFFEYMDKCLIYEIPFNCYGCESRTMAFRLFLHIKFKTARDMLFKLAQTIDKGRRLKKDDIIKFTMKMVKRYNRLALSHGVPKVLVDKFDQVHRQHVESVLLSITQITNDSKMDDRSKMHEILSVFLGAFKSTEVSTRQVLKDLNGELSKALVDVVFDGHKLVKRPPVDIL